MCLWGGGTRKETKGGAREWGNENALGTLDRKGDPLLLSLTSQKFSHVVPCLFATLPSILTQIVALAVELGGVMTVPKDL